MVISPDGSEWWAIKRRRGRHQWSSHLVVPMVGNSEPVGERIALRLRHGHHMRVDLSWPREATRSTGVISGHQRSSEVIRGHQRSSGLSRGHQRSSEVIGHQLVISSHQMPLHAPRQGHLQIDSDHQWSSEVISGHHLSKGIFKSTRISTTDDQWPGQQLRNGRRAGRVG